METMLEMKPSGLKVRAADYGPEDAQAHMVRKAEELADFCLTRAPELFKGWEVRTVFSYCFFHLVDHGVFVARTNGRIRAVLFAWGMPSAEILERHRAGESQWTWRRSKNDADALMLAEVIGEMGQVRKLFKLVAAKWPDWRNKKVFTYRQMPDGKHLVQLRREAIERFLGLGDKKRTGACARPPAGQQVAADCHRDKNAIIMP